ncbi:MAG: hypothetical protein IJB68_06350 [Ruminococcus sp.]|nr:hypothetical protein [Ruminococcus sp.]
MDITKIKQLFTLFSGESCTEEQEPLIQLALTEVEAMLTENADKSDERLNFLCAALANFRYYQAISSQDRSEYTYGGKFINDSEKKNLSFAEGLLKGYFQLCSDIIKDSGFIFMGA